MTHFSPPFPWRQFAIGASLVTLLVAVYFFTFNGYGISRDEWYLFDATESLVRRGDIRLNYEYDAHPPRTLAQAAPLDADTEPLQPLLAIPLFLIADNIPGLGLAHTVWVFNVLITALTAGVVFAYGLALHYSVRVAGWTALIFGLGTIAWPYSRYFFREPLFTLLAFLSAYLVQRLRQQIVTGRVPILTLILFTATFAGALLSKEATLLLVPAILVEALPARLARVRLTRSVVRVLGALVVLTVLLALLVFFADRVFNLSRFDLAERLRQIRVNLEESPEGIRGYLFSPARSLWLFSPVLLLGWIGIGRLIRQRRWRQILTPLVMMVTFIVGYAIVRGPNWYGGTGWGPRYLVPVTPFLMLWLLPVVEEMAAAGAAWWARLAGVFVLLFSLGVQLVGVLVSTTSYYQELAAHDVVPWHEGAWQARWSPVWVHFRLLGDQKIDVVWMYARGNAWVLPVLSLILAVVALACLWWWVQKPAAGRRSGIVSLCALVLVSVVTLLSGLYVIRRDPRYLGDFQPARDLLAQLEAQLKPDDAIVLNDDLYSEFFMNYYKERPVVLTLPRSPGERPSPEQPPEIESPYPEERMKLQNAVTLAYLAERHPRLWLVINSSPFIWWSVRPVEQYLAQHYFPVGEVKATDIARAVLFDTTPAPPVTAQIWPEYPVGVQFGGALELTGFDIPGGTTRQVGDVLPVSLLWRTVSTPPHEYTIALFLVSNTGQVLAERHSLPIGGFGYTQYWRPGSYHRDNHGLAIPTTALPGQYEVWAIVYWWEAPTERLPVTTSDGSLIGDYAQLGTITIE